LEDDVDGPDDDQLDDRRPIARLVRGEIRAAGLIVRSGEGFVAVDFGAQWRDSRHCEGLNYGGTHAQRCNLITASADYPGTWTGDASAGGWHATRRRAASWNPTPTGSQYLPGFCFRVGLISSEQNAQAAIWSGGGGRNALSQVPGRDNARAGSMPGLSTKNRRALSQLQFCEPDSI
jgi:hypothetical protein